MLVVFIVMFIVLVLDRAVKMLAVSFASEGSITLIDKIMDFTLVKNTGAAFSMLNKHTWVLIAITAVFCVILCFVIFSKKLSKPLNIALACVLAGGLGNLYDRIVYGYVIDMFETKFINFPVFNVADIFITCGGIVFVVLYFLEELKKSKAEKNAASDKDNK